MGEKTKFPTLNPDGASVKGCNYIYAPRGQAGEYAPLAANPYRGCGHRCVYCYVPKVIKMSRGDFDAGATPPLSPPDISQSGKGPCFGSRNGPSAGS
jgi:hypothetical protein